MALLACTLFDNSAEASTAKEYKVKAAFIYNFTKFIKWPEDTFTATDEPIVIGFINKNPFGNELEKTLGTRTMQEHPFVIRRVKDAEDAKGVHLLFVSFEDAGETIALLRTIENESILTIGETKGFAARGGIIEFVIDKDKVRFNLNVTAAKKAGLSVNARMQALAKKIY